MIKKHIPQEIPSGSVKPEKTAVKAAREVYLDDTGTCTRCIIYDRDQLRCGNVIAGRAIIEDLDSTTVVLPNYEAVADRYANLIISGHDELPGVH